METVKFPVVESVEFATQRKPVTNEESLKLKIIVELLNRAVRFAAGFRDVEFVVPVVRDVFVTFREEVGLRVVFFVVLVVDFLMCCLSF